MNLEGLRLGLIPVEQFLTIVPGRALEWVYRRAHSALGFSRGGHRSGERVLQGGQGMQSRARALEGPGALLTTRWAAYRRGFDPRWQPRVVHATVTPLSTREAVQREIY